MKQRKCKVTVIDEFDAYWNYIFTPKSVKYKYFSALQLILYRLLREIMYKGKKSRFHSGETTTFYLYWKVSRNFLVKVSENFN